MAWWKLFWNPVEQVAQNIEEDFEQSALENVISEPVRSIVKVMITDRKRFIFQVDRSLASIDFVRYAALDIDTEEEFFVTKIYFPGIYARDYEYSGPSWAKDYEIEWALKTISDHYMNLTARAKRIASARERNRLIEIYSKEFGGV